MKHVLLFLEMDLSLSTGYSINERESTVALLNHYSRYITVVAPSPQYPDTFHDGRIIYIHNHRRYSPRHYVAFLRSARRTLQLLIQNGDVDAVAFRLGFLPILPLLVSRRNVPILLKTMSGALYERSNRSFGLRLLDTIRKPFFSAAVRTSAAGDTPSYALHAWFVHSLGLDAAKLRVLPNGVNERLFSPADPSAVKTELGLDRFQHRIGYVGALDGIRNLKTAIGALSYLSEFPPTGLILVGSGPAERELKAYATETGVADRVVFAGFRPYHAVPNIISCFDVALDLTHIFLRAGRSTVSGCYSQKIPQYLSCGVPVIAAHSQDTSFLNRCRLGTTVDPGDPKGLARAIQELLELRRTEQIDPAAIRQSAIDHFSYSKLAEERFQFWQQVLAEEHT